MGPSSAVQNDQTTLALAESMKRAKVWQKEPFDEATCKQVEQWIENEPSEVMEAFWKELEFGTGGMRGIMGIGSSRMNVYTVVKAAQGLGNWLKKKNPAKNLRVVIAFDSRHNSQKFAQECARVLAEMEIEVHLFKHLRPTPMLSFAVRELGADGGIMITASHNPPQYNGFKAYNSQGCQFYSPDDKEIVAEAAKIDYKDLIMTSKESRRIHLINETFDSSYLKAISSLALCKKVNTSHGEELSIVYTSLHGTGVTLAPLALQSWGFSKVFCVETQCLPNGDFPTVAAPNPEDASALELGQQLLLARSADILIANDPDADRMGVCVRQGARSKILSGQEIAILLADHLLKNSNLQVEPPLAIVKSLVTSPLIAEMAKRYKVACFNVLTGFKYIGRLINLWQGNREHQFLFGAEESLGYLAGTHARDKDGIVAACLISEAALCCKRQGITLADRLEEIYSELGRYCHKLINLTRSDSIEGREEIEKIMQTLRCFPPKTVGRWQVKSIVDLKRDPACEPLQKADLLLWNLEPKAQVIIRPSGTEPKVKVYIDLHSHQDAQSAASELRELTEAVRTLIER